MKVKANWHFELQFECPKCEYPQDYLNTDHHCYNDGWEQIPNNVFEKFPSCAIDAKCDRCGEEFQLEVEEGLS